MERLTVFDGEFWVHKNFPPVGEDTIDEFIDCVKELAARLAAYEDTGLEPDDIKRVFNEDAVLNLAGQALGITTDRLRELAQADREGRCVVIDVKIGQRVWILDVGEYGDDEIAQPLGLEVYGIALSDDHETYYFVKPPLGMDIDPFSHEDIGKTVFLSREEAEKALEGMKDG